MKEQKNEDKLFIFIKSLDKSEKRAFKLYSNLYKGKNDKNYLKLFDIMDNMKEFDKRVLEKNIKEKINTTSIGSVRNYLFKNILECLRLLSKTNNRHSLWNELLDINILIERTMYDEAEKMLQGLKRRIVAKGSPLYTLVVNSRMAYLENDRGIHSTNSYEKTILLLNENLESIEQYKDTIWILNIQKKMALMRLRSAKKQKGNTEELQTILNELLKKSVEEIKGLRTKLFYLRCFVSIYYDLSQYENELIYHQKLLILFKENKDVFYAEDQAPVIINALECFNKNDKKKDFWEHITHLDIIIKRLSKKQDYYIYWKHICLFSYYTLHLDENMPNDIYEKGIGIAKGENYELNSSNCQYMYSVIANYFFVKKVFKKAQEMFDHILLVHNLQPQDLYYFNIKILNIFCYIELDNIKIAQNEVSKLRRKLSRDNIEYEALIDFLMLLAKLTKIFDVLTKRNLIYHKIYQLLVDNRVNDVFGVQLAHLYKWLEEKLNK